jgi:hypothetical protein
MLEGAHPVMQSDMGWQHQHDGGPYFNFTAAFETFGGNEGRRTTASASVYFLVSSVLQWLSVA